MVVKIKRTPDQSAKVEERRNVKVGDGVSMRYYSDVEPCTVIARTAKSITIQEDKATLSPNFKPDMVKGGFTAACVNNSDQEWIIEPDLNGKIFKAYWSEKRGCFQANGCYIFNGRIKRYDYSF